MRVFDTPWWRFPGAPSPEEWLALWGLLTLVVAVVAAFVALRQLIAMREANGEANEATRIAAEASRATSRPYLDVRFDFVPTIPQDPEATPRTGFTVVVIENVGKAAIKHLLLKSDPLFDSSGVGRQGERDAALEWIREKFSGDYVFEYLSPGKKFSYVLDLTKEQMSEQRNLPQRYVVTASYTDMQDLETYTEEFVLDAEPWHLSRVDAEPLAVIPRQLRTMNYYEKQDKKPRARFYEAVKSLVQRRGDDVD